MSLVNKHEKNSQLTIIDYKGYLVFVQQTAFNVYSECSPVDRLRQMIGVMQEATEKRGLSIIFFEDQETRDENNEVL
jgi:hypothetical protein